MDKFKAVTEEDLEEYTKNFAWDDRWTPLSEEMYSMLYTLREYIRKYGEL